MRCAWPSRASARRRAGSTAPTSSARARAAWASGAAVRAARRPPRCAYARRVGSRPRRWPPGRRRAAPRGAGLALVALAPLPVAAAGGRRLRCASEYKELSQTLRVTGTRVLAERSSPLGLVTVVESPPVPLRHAPGLSLSAAADPPPQLGAVHRRRRAERDRRASTAAGAAGLSRLPASALPYHLLRRPRVLVLGAGAGADVLQALYHRARRGRRGGTQPAGGGPGAAATSATSPAGPTQRRVHAAHRRGARLRRGQRRALRPDPGRAARRLRRLVGRAPRADPRATSTRSRPCRPISPGSPRAALLAITRWVALPPRDTPEAVRHGGRRAGAAGRGRPGARSWR